MRLIEWTPAPLVDPAPAFEGIREITATVDEDLRVPVDGRRLMSAARLRCQGGGPIRTGKECLACERIVSIKPDPGRSSVSIKCLWTEVDRVADVMTRPSAIVAVTQTDTLGRADQIAQQAGVHHLLVVNREVVAGTICRCDLADPGSTAGLLRVAATMSRELWTVPPDTSLGAVAATMQRLDAGMLLVAQGPQLLGVVTARELGIVERGHGL